jgi:hypothetical protein
MTESAPNTATARSLSEGHVIDCHAHVVPPTLTRRVLSGHARGCDVRRGGPKLKEPLA